MLFSKYVVNKLFVNVDTIVSNVRKLGLLFCDENVTGSFRGWRLDAPRHSKCSSFVEEHDKTTLSDTHQHRQQYLLLYLL